MLAIRVHRPRERPLIADEGSRAWQRRDNRNPWRDRLIMVGPKLALRGVDRVLDRLTDNWLFDLLTGNWFEGPINNYLDRSHSNTTKESRRRVYLDADGNRIEPPAAESRGYAATVGRSW